MSKGFIFADRETIPAIKAKIATYETTVPIDGSEIDLNLGTVFTKTVNSNVTFNIVHIPEASAICFTIIMTNGGSATVTWPSNVKWSAGEPPELSAEGEDVLTFISADGGQTWYGTINVQGAA